MDRDGMQSWCRSGERERERQRQRESARELNGEPADTDAEICSCSWLPCSFDGNSD